MNFKYYQEKASTTAVYPSPRIDDITNNFEAELDDYLEFIPIMYCALGLAGESGEVAEQVKKSWRNNMKITDERRNKIKDELGDCQPEDTLISTPSGVTKIKELNVGDKVVTYRSSNKSLSNKGFQDKQGNKILGIESRIYNSTLVSVDIGAGKRSYYTPGHKAIAIPYRAFVNKFIVYLMRRGQSWRVGVTKGYGRNGRKAGQTFGPTMRMYAENSDAIWVLDSFDNREDALACEAIVNAKFGIPDLWERRETSACD